MVSIPIRGLLRGGTWITARNLVCTGGTWQGPLLVAIPVWGLSQVYPLASPLILALVIGAVVANSAAAGARRIREAPAAAKFLLRLGVALLGLRLPISDITQLGPFGVIVVVVTVGCTFFATRFVGIRMGLEPEFVSLVAAGFAVCGAAAIAAVQDSVKAKEHLVALALALITLHGTVALVVIPFIGGLLGLDDHATSVWAGASIHEVAQVAAAAALIGPEALAIAMGIKLSRVLMLVPVHRAVARLHHSGPGHLLREVPWFLYAFVAAVLARAIGRVPDQALNVATHAGSICMAAGMFGLGLGIVGKNLWPIPGGAVVLAGVATFIVTSVPLLMLLAPGGP